MKNNTTKKLVLGGIMIGLATVLSFVKVIQMPKGGSVTAASMVPIILYALIFGLKDGLFAAAVYGILQFILDGFVIHPASIIMDYLLGFGAMGLAGLFHTEEKDLTKAIIGGIVGSVARFIMLVVAGATIWGEYAPEGMGVWKFSLGYNATYMVPEIIITAIIIGLVYSKAFDAFKK